MMLLLKFIYHVYWSERTAVRRLAKGVFVGLPALLGLVSKLFGLQIPGTESWPLWAWGCITLAAVVLTFLYTMTKKAFEEYKKEISSVEFLNPFFDEEAKQKIRVGHSFEREGIRYYSYGLGIGVRNKTNDVVESVGVRIKSIISANGIRHERPNTFIRPRQPISNVDYVRIEPCDEAYFTLVAHNKNEKHKFVIVNPHGHNISLPVDEGPYTITMETVGSGADRESFVVRLALSDQGFMMLSNQDNTRDIVADHTHLLTTPLY
jgi:hypothetical protein